MKNKLIIIISFILLMIIISFFYNLNYSNNTINSKNFKINSINDINKIETDINELCGTNNGTFLKEVNIFILGYSIKYKNILSGLSGCKIDKVNIEYNNVNSIFKEHISSLLLVDLKDLSITLTQKKFKTGDGFEIDSILYNIANLKNLNNLELNGLILTKIPYLVGERIRFKICEVNKIYGFECYSTNNKDEQRKFIQKHYNIVTIN